MTTSDIQTAVPRQKRSYWGWLIALLWLAFLVTVAGFSTQMPVRNSDYVYYYNAAQRLLQGIGLYEHLQPGDFAGPPLVVLFVLPIVALVPGYRESALVWLVVNMVMLVSGLALLARTLPNPAARRWLWFAALFFLPTLTTLIAAQMSTLLFLLTVGAYVALSTGRSAWAGALVSVGVWIKFYPGLFLLYFLWKRDWRALAGALVAQVAIIAIQVAMVSPQGFVDFMTRVLPPLISVGEPEDNFMNLSLVGFSSRLFITTPLVQPIVEQPEWAAPVRYSLALVMLVVTAVALVRSRSAASVNNRLEFGLVLVVALLLGSTLYHHGTLSLLVTFVAFVNAQPTQREKLRVFGWCVICAALITINFMLTWASSTPRIPALLLSFPFFGMLLLWGRIAAQLTRSS